MTIHLDRLERPPGVVAPAAVVSPAAVAGAGTPSLTTWCELWLLAEDDVEQVCERLDAQRSFSTDELVRLTRLVRPASRRRHLGARIVARWALARHLGTTPADVTFVRDPSGRPALHPRHPPLDFNLTHTEGVIGCAVVPAGRVGLDAETYPARAEAARLVDVVLTRGERATVEAAPPDRQLHLLAEHWVLKEAYTKALGLGLRHPFDSFEIRDIGDAPTIHDPRGAVRPAPGLGLTVMHSRSGHVMAVATQPASGPAAPRAAPVRVHLVDAALTLTGWSGATAAVLPHRAVSGQAR